MDFLFDISRVLHNRITIFNGGKRYNEINHEDESKLQVIIDCMGNSSAKAQNLKAPITTYSKFIQNSDQTLYLLQENCSVVGFIKTGKRRLFLWDQSGLIHEVMPLCILDFYVHESQQRKGHGKVLFEHVLQREQLQSFEVAIDRPSIKFLNFLRKHYNLHSYIKQNNNYVVFKNFFTTCAHYDHAYKSNLKRRSLPSTIDAVSKIPVSVRTSLSPKRCTPVPEGNPFTSSTNSSSYSMPTVHSKTTFSSPENLTSTVFGDDPKFPGVAVGVVSPEDVSWSEGVRPIVNTSKHAPFLTMRGQPNQRSLQTMLERGNHRRVTDYNGTGGSRYSKYENGLLNRSSATSIRPTAYSWQQEKKYLWKDHLR